MSTAAAKMRAVIAALILAGLLTMTLSALPATAAPTQVTATAGVNIRSGPSTSSWIVGGLYRGQTVTAISTSGGWTKIRFGGRFAYIASRYLTTRKLSGCVERHRQPYHDHQRQSAQSSKSGQPCCGWCPKAPRSG